MPGAPQPQTYGQNRARQRTTVISSPRRRSSSGSNVNVVRAPSNRSRGGSGVGIFEGLGKLAVGFLGH